MKLLITSDVHNDLSIIKKVIEILKKEKIDFLILLGDIGNWGEVPEGLISKLSKYINPERIIFVPGNHETPEISEFWEKIYKIKSLHKKYFEFYDFVFAGIGGGDLPLFLISEEEIKEFLEKIKDKSKYKKLILFTHIHPRYTKSSLIGGGSKELYHFIKNYKPFLVLHGHVHEAGGLEEIISNTRVINVARSIFIIDINKDTLNIKKVF